MTSFLGLTVCKSVIAFCSFAESFLRTQDYDKNLIQSRYTQSTNHLAYLNLTICQNNPLIWLTMASVVMLSVICGSTTIMSFRHPFVYYVHGMSQSPQNIYFVIRFVVLLRRVVNSV